MAGPRRDACGAAGGAESPPSAIERAARSAWSDITMMLMRRFTGSAGRCLSNGTEAARPTTREILSASSPPAISARRAAFPRSADSSQLL